MSRKPIKAEEIIEIVANYYQISVNKMLSNTRERECVLARHVAMYLIRHNLWLPLKEIGVVMQGKKRKRPYDHTTVMHAMTCMFYLLETSDEFDNEMEHLQEAVLSRMRIVKKPKPLFTPVEETKVVRMHTEAESEKVIQKYI